MNDYKSCVKYQMDLCPMARHYADKNGVKLDCSKCRDYACADKNCGDCKHYDARDAYCGVKHESRFFRENSADCNDFEERQEETNMENAEQKHDAVNHPNHYCKGGVECLDAIKAALGDKYEGFLAGNVLKYVYRYPDKNGVEDCKKARFYLDKLIEVLSDEER